MKRLVPALVVVLSLAVGVSAAVGAKPGNSANAKKCQKNGWQSLYARDGQAFASETACASYGAGGGQLIPPSALACLNGGWATLGSTSGSSFASEQACVNYAAGGGTPVAVGADVRLVAVDSDATSPRCAGSTTPCDAVDVLAYNDSSVAVTVTVATTFGGTFSGPGPTSGGVFPGPGITCWAAIGSWSCPGVLVPAGGSGLLWDAYIEGGYDPGAGALGTASITSSSLPDPNTSNNTVDWRTTDAPA